MEFIVNFGTDTTLQTKRDALVEFIGDALAIITPDNVLNGQLAEVGETPEPFVSVRYAAPDEELGITSIIVRKILLANVTGFSVL